MSIQSGGWQTFLCQRPHCLCSNLSGDTYQWWAEMRSTVDEPQTKPNQTKPPTPLLNYTFYPFLHLRFFLPSPFSIHLLILTFHTSYIPVQHSDQSQEEHTSQQIGTPWSLWKQPEAPWSLQARHKGDDYHLWLVPSTWYVLVNWGEKRRLSLANIPYSYW